MALISRYLLFAVLNRIRAEMGWRSRLAEAGGTRCELWCGLLRLQTLTILLAEGGTGDVGAEVGFGERHKQLAELAESRDTGFGEVPHAEGAVGVDATAHHKPTTPRVRPEVLDWMSVRASSPLSALC